MIAFTGLVVLGILAAASGIWASLLLFYAGPQNSGLNTALAVAAAVMSLLTLASLFIRRWRWRMLTAHFTMFGLLLAWWATLAPSNDREWQPDLAKLAHATIDGDRVTVHNIRNVDYRSEFDYTLAWYDKSFDLSKLEGVDLVAVYWMGPAIAHIFVSFAFAGGDHLAISIEARKEKGEGYSILKGFFRQYELYYVVADERDVIRLRTNYRQDPPEDVYVYQIRGSVDNGRRLFTAYINKINDLNRSPEFYNTLTTNCTTNIWVHSKVDPEHPPFSWKILASGYVPQYLYETGKLDTRLPFAELQRSAYVNLQAKRADGAPDFSQRIRTPSGSTKP
jgi:Domain of unknown function (DUF4105)